MLKNKKNSFLGLGAVSAAIGASLCCSVPLLFSFLGIGLFSGAGLLFETLRPYFITLALLLLAYSYYKVFFKKKFSKIDCECKIEKPANKKNIKLSLLFVSIFVIGFSLFPQFTNLVFSGNKSLSAIEKKNTKIAILTIEGMTCQGCVISVKNNLEKIKNVISVNVVIGKAVVSLLYNSNSEHKLKKAIEDSGYKLIKIHWE